MAESLRPFSWRCANMKEKGRRRFFKNLTTEPEISLKNSE